MSGDGIQVLAALTWCEELNFSKTRVVPAQACGASTTFTHGVVASHRVAFPQRILVRQLALLQTLDQDGWLLVQFSGTAVWCRYL